MNNVTPQEAIDVLNRIHAADPTVLPELIAYRVPCNVAVADDPTVQVGPRDDVLQTEHSDGRDWKVGLLGVLNGIFGIRAQTQGWIAASFDDEHNLTGFVLTGDE